MSSKRPSSPGDFAANSTVLCVQWGEIGDVYTLELVVVRVIERARACVMPLGPTVFRACAH